MGLFDKLLKKKEKNDNGMTTSGDETSPGNAIPLQSSPSDMTSPGASIPGTQQSLSLSEKKKKQRQLRIAILSIGLIAIILLLDEPQDKESSDSKTALDNESVNTKLPQKDPRRIGASDKKKVSPQNNHSDIPNKELIEPPLAELPKQNQMNQPSISVEKQEDKEFEQQQNPTDIAITTRDAANVEIIIDGAKINEEIQGKGKSIASVEDENISEPDTTTSGQANNIVESTAEDQGQDQPETNFEISKNKNEDGTPTTDFKKESDDLLNKLELEMKEDESRGSIIKFSDVNSIKTSSSKPFSLEEADYEYYGRGLVYNCQGEHWACVDQTIYQKCAGIEQYSKTQNSESECATISVFESDADCALAQTERINDLAKAPNICQGND